MAEIDYEAADIEPRLRPIARIKNLNPGNLCVAWCNSINAQGARIMTVKTAVSFTERHHRFAKRKVQEGSCASVSSLVAQGIEKLMQEEQEREAVLSGMADAIRTRMRTPRPEFVEMSENDTLFDDVRSRLNSRG